MEKLEAFRSITEVWENSNFIWFMNEKEKYNNFNDLYENEGTNIDNWSKDHIRMENYLRNGYRQDRSIPVRDFDKIKTWSMEQYKEFLSNEAEKRLEDMVKRVKDITGDIQSAELLDINTSSIARIKVKGIWSDVLVVVKFLQKNKKLHFKTWINETRRFF